MLFPILHWIVFPLGNDVGNESRQGTEIKLTHPPELGDVLLDCQSIQRTRDAEEGSQKARRKTQL